MSAAATINIGAVVIGRNEGERLGRCLVSTIGQTAIVVYVDSGSTDDSVARAKVAGAVVVSLDPAVPFTAARARNMGAKRLMELDPCIEVIQFIDGDCELVTGWIAAAAEILATETLLAVVCGRRSERTREATIYNRLCDMEWDTPIGPAASCGGDAMVRVSAFREVGGFRDELIAGEEPELCLRLRERGYGILRIDRGMTIHDAAMTSIRQWWRRGVRCGHAWAEGNAMHGGRPHRYRTREVRSTLLWAGVLPLTIFALAWPTMGLSMALLGLYLFLFLRIYGGQVTRGRAGRDANLYAASCVVAKFAHLAGMMRFWWARLRGRRSAIIEYKGAQPQGSAR